ncbi:MAG: D-alanyl-D-alanine carboxypeptidase, partial [Halioglobus sp.]|nr:D-alanyl-D-alanine carboxypeptidase [Halioglobus sp.]
QYNSNTLLLSDSSVDGIKTGHTQAAGYCLVASAKRGDMRLISVVMGAESTKARKEYTASLFNYGFHFYETATVYPAMAELEQARIWKGQQDFVPVGLLEETVLTLPRGGQDTLATEVEVLPELVAPVAVGDPVGTVTLRLGRETVHEAPLVTLVAVPPAGLFARLWDTLLMYIASLFAAR